MKQTKLMLGNNLDSLKKLPDNSVDSVVSDPPYGLSFMGKKWDYDVPSVEFWKEVYRVLKPGGHVLSFGGTRTYHRMVVNIEDAGFEIRDQIQWIYGSGFPKSHNISKAIDKVEGNERKVIGKKIQRVDGTLRNQQPNGGFMKENVVTKKSDGYIDVEEPGSDNSKKYEGWGTALKPANEPICVARKPLSEKSVAENVLRWGTGGINVDGCRVGSEVIETNMKNTKGGLYNLGNQDRTNEVENTFNEGRFPANIIFECICDEVIKGEKGEPRISDKKGGSPIFGSELSVNYQGKWHNDKGDIHTNPDCPCRILDEQSGILSNQSKSKRKGGFKTEYVGGENINKYETLAYTDKGGASRFFYQSKVSKAERNMGLEDIKSNHPTVKPVSLMTYLVRMVTPPNGIVLDPFMGSGSTGIAAQLEGFRFVGMEMDENYFKIAEARINNFEKYKKFIK
jgi:site-specific DNA-methyltransferase (adenine-specific)